MGKRYGKYVFIMYMITKMLYIANAVIQLFLLQAILGRSGHRMSAPSLEYSAYAMRRSVIEHVLK